MDTDTMQNRLLSIAQEAMAELDQIQIPYCKNVTFCVNTRARKRWGNCRKVSSGNYKIQISHRLLDDNVGLSGAKNTVIHELLHTCPGGMSHKGSWAKYASKVNRAFGYNIKRTSTSEEKECPDNLDDMKYVLTCQGCGNTWGYARYNQYVATYQNRHCGDCGGKLLLTKGSIHPEKIAPYVFRCDKCGATVERFRASKFTQHPERYSHNGCNGHFRRI